MEFRVLGPLEVSAAGRPLRLGGLRQRTVLAVLLLNANELVPRERLIDAVWGDAPPAQAAASVRGHVARLRKLLAPETDGRSIIETQRKGYVLRIAPESLDLARFRGLVEAGKFEQALALWRGPAFADLDGGWAKRERESLEELWLSALEERIDAGLAAEHTAELVFEQPEAVEAGPGPMPEAPSLLRRTRAGTKVLALAGVAALALGVALLAGGRELGSSSSSLQGNSVVAIDSRTNSVLGEVSLGGRPGGVAVGAGAVWAGNRDDQTLLRVGMRERRVVETIGLDVEPIGVAAGAGSVWVLGRDGVVLQIDPSTSHVIATIELGSRGGGSCCDRDIAFAKGAVWVSYGGSLTRIDADTHRVELTGFRSVRSIGSSGRALWGVLGVEFERIRRLQPLGDAVRPDDVDAIDGRGGLIADRRHLWTGSDDGKLRRISPATGRVSASLSLNRPIADVAMSPGGDVVWVALREG